MEWKARLSHDERGFTLVELMVALTVLATGIVAAVGVMNSSLNMVSGTSARTRAVALATRELEELRAIPYEELKEQLKNPNNTNDTWVTTENEQFGGQTFTIERTVRWADRDTKLEAYMQADVTVVWNDRHGDHIVEQATIVYPGGQGQYRGPVDESGDSTTTSADAPPPPTALTATAVATDPASSISLAWVPGVVDPVTDVPVHHWRIEYTTDGVNWHTLTDSLPHTQLTYEASGLSADTAYTFRVAGVSADGVRSGWSNEYTLRTAVTLSVSCALGTASITPYASRRVNGNADSPIEHDPFVGVSTNGLCDGLTIHYKPKTGVNRILTLNPPADGATWTAYVNGTNDAWEMGLKELVIVDTNGVRYGQIMFQVCAHNAKSCP